MLGRRRPAAPSNEAHAVIPYFTPDPHGAAMFAGVVRGNAMAGGRPVIDARGAAWDGPLPFSPQRADMTGAGFLSGARPVVQPGTRLDQERGLANDPVQSIFEQRMAARRFS